MSDTAEDKLLAVSFWHAGRWRRYMMERFNPGIPVGDSATGKIWLGYLQGEVVHWRGTRTGPLYGGHGLVGYADRDEHGTYIFTPVGFYE